MLQVYANALKMANAHTAFCGFGIVLVCLMASGPFKAKTSRYSLEGLPLMHPSKSPDLSGHTASGLISYVVMHVTKNHGHALLH